jgi:2-dehydro-3-deoxyglucarate aldolase/4-hydroxy-2-oxoheptanedioate aldolase
MRDGFAARLGAGEPLLGAWSSIGDPVVAEVLAAEGFDFVVLDGEHSENDIGDLAAGIRAVDAAGTETVPVVRASGPDRAEIRRLLDLGPAGIVIPQIESRAEAEAAVAATQYPPDGVRGVAGGRASGYGADLAEYVGRANDAVATILQVETQGAVDDVEAIAGLAGLDALFVGPADLSARLGAFGEFDGEPFRAAIETIREATEAADVPLGTLATAPGNVQERWADWGMDFLVVGTDVGYLRAGAAAFRDRFESH